MATTSRLAVEDDIWRKARAKAELEGVSVSRVVEQALRLYLTPELFGVERRAETVKVEPAITAAPSDTFNSKPFTPVPKRGK